MLDKDHKPMELYQGLTITGKQEDIRLFLADLKHDANGWMLNTPVLAHAEASANLLAFDVPLKSQLKPATLFLQASSEGSVCSVTNIVPPAGELSAQEYNRILQAFYEECVQDKAQSYCLDVHLSRENVQLEDTLSPENMRLLRQFVDKANKSTGSSYPSDYERWVTFIGASVRDREILDADLLRLWLMEQGFPGDVATDLHRDYRLGVDLTKHWKSGVQEQDTAGATR
jgi:hypothetical protein